MVSLAPLTGELLWLGDAPLGEARSGFTALTVPRS